MLLVLHPASLKYRHGTRILLGRHRPYNPRRPALASQPIWTYVTAQMSHRQNSATAEILRLFRGPKELGAPAAARIAEPTALAYDVALHRMTARGLKAADLDGISRVIGATAGAAADVRRAVVPDSTWKRRKGKTLSPTESDQTARLARVTALALDTWRGNLDAVREFLAAPHPELDGERPVHAMQTDSGCAPRRGHPQPAEAWAPRLSTRSASRSTSSACTIPDSQSLDAGGARAFGGRWNSPGAEIVYASLSYGGAILETRVHANVRTPPPRDIAAITVPAGVRVAEIVAADAPRLGRCRSSHEPRRRGRLDRGVPHGRADRPEPGRRAARAKRRAQSRARRREEAPCRSARPGAVGPAVVRRRRAARAAPPRRRETGRAAKKEVGAFRYCRQSDCANCHA